MTDLSLSNARIREGVWEGLLTATAAPGQVPDLVVTHLDTELPDVQISDAPGTPNGWHVRVPIPLAALSEGVQTFLIRDRRDGTRLASFAIVTGEPLEDDIRAEMDLLRAELDMLKKAFRRHCLETADQVTKA